MEANCEAARDDLCRRSWDIDPRKIGQCHLGDFFIEDLMILQGMAEVLRDLGCLSDEPGEYPKVTNISIDGILALAQTIERGVESLKEKLYALDREMCSRGWATYSWSGAGPGRDSARVVQQPGDGMGGVNRQDQRQASRQGASSNGRSRNPVRART